MDNKVRYRELDEVRAPADVPEAGVRAEFQRPRHAVEVMYDDADGEPGPCVIYSPDLAEVYSYYEGYNI